MMGPENRESCTLQKAGIIVLEFLEQEQISRELLDGVRAYRAQYPAAPAMQSRVPKPRYRYYGKEVWEAAIAAVLCGENLLPAKMCWRRIWPWCSAVPAGMCPST